MLVLPYSPNCFKIEAVCFLLTNFAHLLCLSAESSLGHFSSAILPLKRQELNFNLTAFASQCFGNPVADSGYLLLSHHIYLFSVIFFVCHQVHSLNERFQNIFLKV